MFPEEYGNVKLDFKDVMHAIETGYLTDGDDPVNLFESRQPLVKKSLIRGSREHEDTLRFAETIDRFHRGELMSEMFPAFVRLMREAISTSDFTQLTANLLYWKLLPLYAEYDNQWERMVSINDAIPDFRQIQVTRIEGFDGPLPQVKELADYTMDAPIARDQNYRLSKFGKIVSLSWEAQLNDYLGMFRFWPEWLARATRATENSFITGLMVAATGPNTLLFSTDGSTNGVNGTAVGGVINKTTAAPLNEANLIAAYVAMTTRTIANGNPMSVKPRFLVVPPELLYTAQKLTESPGMLQGQLPTSGTAGSNIMIPSINVVPKLGLEVIENRWIHAIDVSANVANTWYLIGDPGAGAAMEAGFLIGHRQPMVFRRVGNAEPVNGGGGDPMQGDFEHDAMAWKVRHVLGGTALEPRFAYAAVGA